MHKFIICFLIAAVLGGCGYNVSIRTHFSSSYLSSKDSVLLSYDATNDKIDIFDIKKKIKIAEKFYRCFFPSTMINPRIEDSKVFNPKEFYIICGYTKSGSKICK